MDKNRGLWRGKTTPKRSGGFDSVWVEGDLIRSKGVCYIHPFANAVKVEGELGRLIVMHEVDPSTLGECTGLTDKNGKFIFKGDIVEVRGEDCFAVVGWGENTARFVLNFVCANEISDFDSYCGYECEIIGNIHDNPELLKATGEDIGNAAQDTIAPATQGR